MKALFVGAGASWGTLGNAGPPVAAGFGSALSSVPVWDQRYPELASVAQHLGRPLDELGLEEIWTSIDYYAKLHRAFRSTPWCRRRVGSDLKKALLRLYGGTCDAAADGLPCPGDYTLARLLSSEQLQEGDVVVSFNYDTLAERLAQRLGRRLWSVGDELQKGAVNFAKPHGSASWWLNLGDQRVECPAEGAEPFLNSLAEAEVDKGREPLMLGTVPIKSELIEEVQRQCGVPEVFNVVMRQWRAVVQAVAQADVLVVAGYSFPREDQYGRFLFREAMRSRPGSVPIRVEYYETPDRAAEVGASIVQTFLRRGQAMAIEWLGPIERPRGRPPA